MTYNRKVIKRNKLGKKNGKSRKNKPSSRISCNTTKIINRSQRRRRQNTKIYTPPYTSKINKPALILRIPMRNRARARGGGRCGGGLGQCRHDFRRSHGYQLKLCGTQFSPRSKPTGKRKKKKKKNPKCQRNPRKPQIRKREIERGC